MENMELKSESGLRVETILNLGSEFLMDQQNLWRIQTLTTQKFLQIYLKNKSHNWMWRFVQPDQNRRQNHKEENLLITFVETSYSEIEETPGSISIHFLSLIGMVLGTSIFFDTAKKYNEKMMEQFNFGEVRILFRSISKDSFLVRQSLDSMLGSRRRSTKKISVLHWCFRENCLSPSSSRTFRGQCNNSEWIFPIHLQY